jgi:hypothetical protein
MLDYRFTSLLAILFPTLLAALLTKHIELCLYVCCLNLIITITIPLFFRDDLNKIKIVNYFNIFLLLISSFSIASYYSSVGGGSESYPYIPGGDGETYLSFATDLSKSNIFIDSKGLALNYAGYPIILAIWFNLFWPNLFIGLSLNYLLLIFSILFIYKTTYLITQSNLTSLYTIICSFLSPLLITNATLLLKDTLIFFCFSLITYLSTHGSFKGYKIYHYFILFIPIIILGVTRTPYLFFILLIFLVTSISNRKKINAFVFVMLAIIYLLIPYFLQYTLITLSKSEISDSFNDNLVLQGVFSNTSANVGTVSTLVSNYANLNFILKLFLLPIPFFIQYVTPFDFTNNAFYTNHIWYFAHYQLNALWYMFGGIFFLFALGNYKLINNKCLQYFFFLGIFFYAFIAFIYAGTLPRYVAPAFVFILPTMGYFLNLYFTSKQIKFKILHFSRNYYYIGLMLFIAYILFKSTI